MVILLQTTQVQHSLKTYSQSNFPNAFICLCFIFRFTKVYKQGLSSLPWFWSLHQL